MGNSSSTSSSGDSTGPDNGVSLSEQFQQTILKDFQTQIQEQQQMHVKANADLTQRHAQFMQEKQAVLAAGDKRWDALSAKFEKQVIRTDAVASKLQDKYVKASEVCLYHVAMMGTGL
jgi:hypothetical protein